MKAQSKLRIEVMRGEVLGTKVYRGFAKISDLAIISKPDIFDQKNNPQGTQRDLSPKHAKDAYTYINSALKGYLPEVLLCVRNRNIIKFIPQNNTSLIGILEINIGVIEKSNEILISRIDGNHRLHYADGNQPGFPMLDKLVSFSIAFDISLEDEIKIFRDINNNQKPMNTSHLDNIESRLSKQERLKMYQPELYISKKLETDSLSPFKDKIFEGGVKPAGTIMPLRSLVTGIKYLKSKSSKLSQVRNIDIEYKLILNYFSATKKWNPDCWKDSREFLMLRGAGFMILCFVGGEVIDRALNKKAIEVNDMLKILKSGKKWDWSTKGDFQGISGAGGASKKASEIISEFQDEDGVSLRELFDKILKD